MAKWQDYSVWERSMSLASNTKPFLKCCVCFFQTGKGEPHVFKERPSKRSGSVGCAGRAWRIWALFVEVSNIWPFQPLSQGFLFLHFFVFYIFDAKDPHIWCSPLYINLFMFMFMYKKCMTHNLYWEEACFYKENMLIMNNNLLWYNCTK